MQLEGAFDAVYVEGDNGPCLATDTMKNTVYALARQDPIDHVESFAPRLADHFLAKPAVTRVRISGIEQPWDRLSAGGRPHPHAFVQAGAEQWTAVVTRDAQRQPRSSSGLANLVVLKTTDSAFCRLPARRVHDAARHRRPHPGDVDHRVVDVSRRHERLLGARAACAARWSRRSPAHDSRSVQHTLYAMGEAALAACADSPRSR